MTASINYHVGDWVIVKFPTEETGWPRKLSRPWNGPYRITTVNGPGESVSKIYYPEFKFTNLALSFVQQTFFWYGGKRRGPGCPPKWVEQVPNDVTVEETNENGYDSRAPTSQGDHTNSQDNVIPGNSESRGVHHKMKSGLTQQKRTNNRYSLHQNPHPSKKYSDWQAWGQAYCVEGVM